MTDSRRIVLTGGAGFIGSHLAEALLRRGNQLTIVDSLDEFYSPAWKQANLEEVRRAGCFQFFPADICDAERLREILSKPHPDLVFTLPPRALFRPSIDQHSLTHA